MCAPCLQATDAHASHAPGAKRARDGGDVEAEGKRQRMAENGEAEAAAPAAAPAAGAAASAAAVVPDADMTDADTHVPEGAGAGAASDAPSTSAAVRYTDENTAYVKGLQPGVQDAELRALFEPCGGLAGVRPVRDPAGACRGFAYVEFDSEGSLAKAIELHGTDFQGRRLL
eukprot:123347-Chlamydomonas_euryale.AAC.1